MPPIYCRMIRTLGDKAWYCGSVLVALGRPIAAAELRALTDYDRVTVTGALRKLQRYGIVARVGRRWQATRAHQLKGA